MRLAEGLALAGVAGALVDAALAQAGGQGGHGDPALLQGAQEVAEAGAALAQGVGHRHPARLEDQLAGVGGVPADLPVGAADPVPGGAGGHDDVGDLVAAVRSLAGHRGDGDQGGAVQAGVGDERLGAVDDPLVAVQGGPGGQRARVRAAARLGEPEGAEPLAGGQGPEPPLVLLGGAVAPDRHGRQADRGLEGDGHRGVDPGQLLDGQAQGGVVGTHAADLLGERQPEQAHAGHLVEHHRVEGLVPVHGLGPGRHHLLGEGADDLAELLLLGGQLVVHRHSLVG